MLICSVRTNVVRLREKLRNNESKASVHRWLFWTDSADDIEGIDNHDSVPLEPFAERCSFVSSALMDANGERDHSYINSPGTSKSRCGIDDFVNEQRWSINSLIFI
jgi:hypothetical protein